MSENGGCRYNKAYLSHSLAELLSFQLGFYTADKAFDSSGIRTPLLRDEI